jgi:hypothetical protein
MAAAKSKPKAKVHCGKGKVVLLSTARQKGWVLDKKVLLTDNAIIRRKYELRNEGYDRLWQVTYKGQTRFLKKNTW